MRILFVLHQFFPLHITGTEQYARALALQMRQEGHDVRVFAFEPLVQYAADDAMGFERDEDVDGIPVHRFGLHPVTAPNRELCETENPLVSEIYTRYLDDNPVDLVHVFHARHMGEAAIGAPAERGIPVVVNLMDFWFLCPNFILLRRDEAAPAPDATSPGEGSQDPAVRDGILCDGPPEGGLGCIRCLDPELREALDVDDITQHLVAIGERDSSRGIHHNSPVRRANALLGRKERMLSYLQRANVAIAPSEFLRGMFIQNGHPADHLSLVRYGLDPERFASAPPRKSPPGRPHLDIGYVGSLTRHKGVHVLLDAVAQLDDPRIRVHIWGDPRSQPGYSDRLIEECSDDRVTFHGRFDASDLGTVLATLDLLVVPSLWYENTPFSVLEASWFGLPVVASDLGGISEVVHDGTDGSPRNGMLFPHGDAAALAACLQRALDDPEAALTVDEGTRPSSIADNTKTFLDLYRSLVPRTGEGS